MRQPHPEQYVQVYSEPIYRFDNRGPVLVLQHRLEGSYSREISLDPMPCYAHNVAQVEKELAHLRTVAPLDMPLQIAVIEYEESARCNGFFFDAQRAKYDELKKDWEYFPCGYILLSGKRTPIHPAMTRYLVAHEYGHAVNNELCRLMNMKDNEFDDFYINDVRPNANKSYGARKWHLNVGELIANDFRVLIARREMHYWPHEGFARPEHDIRVLNFWRDAQKKLLGETE